MPLSEVNCLKFVFPKHTDPNSTITHIVVRLYQSRSPTAIHSKNCKMKYIFLKKILL